MEDGRHGRPSGVQPWENQLNANGAEEEERAAADRTARFEIGDRCK